MPKVAAPPPEDVLVPAADAAVFAEVEAPRKAKKAKRAANALEGSPSHLLQRALQVALDLYAAEAGKAAPSRRQVAVLAAAEAHPGSSQTALVRLTGVDRSTLAELVTRMIAKGWLARERSAADARANVVRLTEGGREALDRARPQAAAADAKLLKRLGAGKRDAFVAALQKLTRGPEAEADKPLKPGKAEKKAKKAAKAAAAEATTTS